ncbi:hypothetical protein HUT06_29015 [Actinomadura sp. NAK00032]|uniref:hypothetical protein n=1 Tax=Actinomadura sp. NAK00032 TaxID=2742128 RepID=UPI00159113E4|nr:hypothetical protein [Actinomadura sp. NAK00032]QKW37550.1 hypothetical protein HUT06_29015 [Actinomadura sp. NAK00032]
MISWKAPPAAAAALLIAAGLTAAGLASPAAAAARGDFRTVALPFFWPSNTLSDIAAASSDSVWISGHQGEWYIPTGPVDGKTIPGNPVVRRWQNGAWVEYDLPNLRSDGRIEDVDALGPEDVWINGTRYLGTGGSEPYMAHFTGSGFTEVALPATAADGGAALQADDSGIWLTTAADIYRWTGTTWAHVAARPDVYQHVSSIRAADDIWVLGAATITETELVASHWDGRTWQRVPVRQPPVEAVTLLDMIALSPSDVWAVGSRYQSPATPVILHWDGTSWTDTAVPPGLDALTRIVKGENGTLWALGHSKDEPAKPGLIRYSGGTWERVPTTAVPNRIDFKARALAVVPGTGALWTLGTGVIGGPVVLTDG